MRIVMRTLSKLPHPTKLRTMLHTHSRDSPFSENFNLKVIRPAVLFRARNKPGEHN